jgi:hypothetical protein
MNGWKPTKTVLVVNSYGHRQEFVPVPMADGFLGLVPEWGAR